MTYGERRRGRGVRRMLNWLIPISGALVVIASSEVLATELSPTFAAQTEPVRDDVVPTLGHWLDDHSVGLRQDVEDWSGAWIGPLGD